MNVSDCRTLPVVGLRRSVQRDQNNFYLYILNLMSEFNNHFHNMRISFFLLYPLENLNLKDASFARRGIAGVTSANEGVSSEWTCVGRPGGTHVPLVRRHFMAR